MVVDFPINPLSATFFFSEIVGELQNSLSCSRTDESSVTITFKVCV